MKAQTLQTRVVAGMQLTLPQDPEKANLIENWTVDHDTDALVSRIGYEKYRPDPADAWAPFTALGRIDSLYVLQQSTAGARQSILFESGGSLYLYYEVGQANVLLTLRSRTEPTSTDTASVYAEYGDRVVITNGYDAPIMVRPWPLDISGSITATQLAQLSRAVGWYGNPPQPDPLKVAPLDASAGGASTQFFTGDSTRNYFPTYPQTSGFGNIFGMGFADATDGGIDNDYQFRVSFISDTGSESPLSEPAIISWRIRNGHSGYRYAPTIRIPTGPPGTVARRVYSTFDDQTDFYFSGEARNNVEDLFHCFRRSSTFTIPAPLAQDSSIFPATRARCCAIFNDCLFLDGGVDDGNRLYFSKPTLIDQFGAADYISLSTGGGAVTGLYSYYNNLIVFRESSIDILSGRYPNFQVQTLSRQVACRSPSSVDAVPGLGVVFLSLTGIFLISGGTDGGAVVRLEEIGADIRSEVERLTPECAPRAVGKFSPTLKEYHLYIPANGNDRPNLGFVYHLEKQGWSIRSGFPVGCIDRLHNGTLIFGHHTGNPSNQNVEAGLFVISGTRAMGGTLVEDAYTPGPPPTSVYECAWQDFGDAQIKKQVQYVTLWIATTGSVTLNLSYFKDFEYVAVGSDSRYIAQPPDRENQPVYDTALVGTAEWQDSRLVPVRIPVALESCSWFKFRLETTDDIMLVGHEIEFAARGTTVIAGKTR